MTHPFFVLLRIRACSCAAKSLFVSRFQFMLARFKFPFSFCGCPFFSNLSGMVIWSSSKGRVLVASNRPPFVLIRSYIRIQATLLRIAAPANFPTSPSALYRVFDTFPTLFLESGPHLQPHHNGGAAPNVLTLIYLIHLLLSSLCSQSATCSFLFRVLLLLAVVN